MATHLRVIVAVDHDQPDALRGDVLQQRGVAGGIGRGEHDAVHLPRPEHVDFGTLLLGILAGHAQQQSVSPRARDRFEAGDDLDEERVHQVGNDHAEGMGAPKRQAPGDGIGPIAKLLDARQHARAGGRPDVGVVIQDFGDRRDGNPELRRDAFHRGRHAGGRRRGATVAVKPLTTMLSYRKIAPTRQTRDRMGCSVHEQSQLDDCVVARTLCAEELHERLPSKLEYPRDVTLDEPPANPAQPRHELT